jgi:hypothetical protein
VVLPIVIFVVCLCAGVGAGVRWIERGTFLASEIGSMLFEVGSVVALAALVYLFAPQAESGPGAA